MMCSQNSLSSLLFALLALFLLQLFLLEPAVANTVTGMPWETPLQKIKNSLTGPVALIISLLGVSVAGVSLIFGSEFSDFTRRLIMLVLVIGLLVSASSLLTTLFGVSGALVL